MSPKRDRTVLEIVEKYRRKFKLLERPLLRKLIRLENPEIFKPESSKLKTLDRALRKLFKQEQNTPYRTVNSKSPEANLQSKPTIMLKEEYEKFEKQNKDWRLPLELRQAYCEEAIDAEVSLLKDNDPEYLKKEAEIRIKYFRIYNLI